MVDSGQSASLERAKSSDCAQVDEYQFAIGTLTRKFQLLALLSRRTRNVPLLGE
jgi:hypothetical protein